MRRRTAGGALALPLPGGRSPAAVVAVVAVAAAVVAAVAAAVAAAGGAAVVAAGGVCRPFPLRPLRTRNNRNFSWAYEGTPNRNV